jgi:hypothetical protein
VAELLLPYSATSHVRPNAIKHYLQIPPVCTEHASHLIITITPEIKIKFPSLSAEIECTGLDYFRADVVHPPALLSSSTTVSHPGNTLVPVIAYSKALVMTLYLLHQRFGSFSYDVLDTTYRQQTLLGLPRIPPPRYEYDCPVCSLGNLPQFHKGKTLSMATLKPGELLHMDFEFWDIVSRRLFTAMLTIVDAKTRMLWIFCTSSKKPPIHILKWFFANLRREPRALANIRVDEDGALSWSAAFATYLRDDEQLNLQTTGGYASFLNGKVERPNRTLADRARCLLLNAAPPRIGVTPRNMLLIYIELHTIPPLHVHHISPGTAKSSMLKTCTYGVVVFYSQHTISRSHKTVPWKEIFMALPRLGVCFFGLISPMTTSSMHMALDSSNSVACTRTLPLERDSWTSTLLQCQVTSSAPI